MEDKEKQPNSKCIYTPKSKSTQASQKKTRKTNEVLGILGGGLTDEDATIKCSKLPTSNQVLRCIMYHTQSGLGAQTKFRAGQIVYKQLVEFYAKANIPMITERKAIQKIVNLLEENKKIRSVPVLRRSTDAFLSRLNNVEEDLKKTFVLWPKNVLELVTIQEDRDFIIAMQTDRQASFGNHDKVLKGKVQRRICREEKQEQLREAELKRKSCQEINAGYDSDDQLQDADSESDNDKDFVDSTISSKRRSHKRSVFTGSPAFWPHNVLQSPQVIETAVRNSISSTALCEVTRTLVEATGGDPKAVVLSYASTYRYRLAAFNTISNEIKANWTPPDIAALHWDGKLMDTLGNEAATEERLPILVSGVGGVKLLGVPAIQKKTDTLDGPKIADAAIEQLKLWDITSNVRAMVFDTTASNTGAITAACISVQQRLDRELLWLACRHHVGEVILTHVWDDLGIEVSKAPEVQIFERFKSNFESQPYKDSSNFLLPSFPGTLDDKKAEIISLVKNALQQDFSRGDYKELLQLVLVYLGSPPKDFKMRRPGALHKARWMAKLLYSLKIILLSENINELPKGSVFGSGQFRKLVEFTQFFTFCYIPWWISCPLPAAAPTNDIKLLETLYSFKQ